MIAVKQVLLSVSVVLSFSPLISRAQETAPSLGGQAVPGVCLISREAIFANAKAGVSATEQLQRLASQSQEQFSAEQTKVNAELQSLGLLGTTVRESQLTEQQRAGVQKLQSLQQMAAERSRQIEQARTKALQRISEEAQPVIAQAYTRHNCGLLLDRNVVLGGNQSNDLTAEVVQELDTKITTVAVSL